MTERYMMSEVARIELMAVKGDPDGGVDITYINANVHDKTQMAMVLMLDATMQLAAKEQTGPQRRVVIDAMLDALREHMYAKLKEGNDDE